MIKSETNYYDKKTGVSIAVNEEVNEPYISVYDGAEPCSGVVRRWGKPNDIIKELEYIIKLIKNLPK